MGNVRGDPAVHITDLGRRTNFAQIRLQGTMASDLRFFPSQMGSQRGQGTLEFRLDDGTGILKIRAYEDVTQEIVALGRVPSPGDLLKVRGTYQYKARSDFVIIGSASSLEIVPADTTVTTSLEAISEMAPKIRDGEIIQVPAVVEQVRLDRYDLVYLIGDGTGEQVDVVLSLSVLELLDIDLEEGSEGPGPRGGPRIGDTVRVVGALRWNNFDDMYQIVIGSPGRIKRVLTQGQVKAPR